MDDKLLLEDPFTFFTSNLDFGISQMRNNLMQIVPDLAETSEKDYVSEVIYEFCESLKFQLTIYILECSLLHEFDILYLRRRRIFTNELISELLSFLRTEFYASIPRNPIANCLNLCLVNTGEAIVPHFYLKRPLPPRSVEEDLMSLLQVKKPQLGDECYLIDHHWYRSWKQTSSVEPGLISNIRNVETAVLNGFNPEPSQYDFVPEWGWRYLIAWYGIFGCKLGIRRVLIEDWDREIVPETTPDDIWCFLYPNYAEFQIIRLPSGDTFDRIMSKIKHIYNIEPHKGARLYYGNVISGMHCIKWTLFKGVLHDLSALKEAGAALLATQDKESNWPDPTKPQ